MAPNAFDPVCSVSGWTAERPSEREWCGRQLSAVGRSGQQASMCNILLRWAWNALSMVVTPFRTGKQASGQCTPRGVFVPS